MILYHGTTEAIARASLTEGLKPRGLTGKRGNWDHTVTSNADTVYLTSGYAGYFAANATEGNWGIIAIDTDQLDPDAMHPDEDFIEQATRTQTIEDDNGEEAPTLDAVGLKERTLWFRDRVEQWAHHWETSVEGLGTCGHLGVIPPEAIVGVSVFDPSSNPGIAMLVTDPMITIVNWQIMRTKYQALTRWLMGGSIDFDEYAGVLARIPDYAEQERPKFERMINARDGLEILRALDA